MLSAIENHVRSICLSVIEHQIRNKAQGTLHDLVVTEHMVLEKWKRVSDYLGIREGTLQKLRSDDGSSSGPSLRETVLYLKHHAGLMICHETLVLLQVQAGMDGAQGLGKEGPEDCRQGRQRHADHRLDPSEEGGALQRTRGFLISEEKAPLLQDDGHRLQRFSRTADVMDILALQHRLQGQVYSPSFHESILMLRKGWPCIGNLH